MHVPLVDLQAQHAEVAPAVEEGWTDVVNRCAFVSGQEVEDFERAYAAFSRAAHCVGVASGTDALELALRAVGVRAGDGVVVPANSFIASASAVRRVGAVPRFVDVDPDTLLLDPEQVAGATASDRVRVVMPVHLFGQMAPVRELQQLAEQSGVVLVEDAAQAQGAVRGGVPAGSVGAVAATSFYPGKNLGAYGDAGAVLTNDPDVADRVRLLRDHGSARKYAHDVLGFNSRLDTLQAVVLNAKLRHLSNWNARRRLAAERYRDLLQHVDRVRLPTAATDAEHVWHLYVVRVPDRDRVLSELHERGVGAGIHYPQPLHLTGAMRDLGYRAGDFPVTEAAAGEILSLPLFPHITEDQQERVAAALVEALS